MSRIGKKPITIPEGVEIKIDNQKVTVKGPKGEISKEFRPEIKIEKRGKEIFVFPKNENLIEKKPIDKNAKKIKSFWGLTRMLIANMIQGVVSGFEKKLELNGVGYRAEVLGEELILQVGFSHPVKLKIPQEIKVSVEKNIIVVFGVSKEAVGQFAATTRKVKPAEPYKGKGIKYLGEKIRRKLGKKAVSAAV